MSYKQRVSDERDALHIKLSQLVSFLDTDFCKSLPEAEIQRLKRQATHMSDYLQVLNEHIDAFTADAPQ